MHRRLWLRPDEDPAIAREIRAAARLPNDADGLQRKANVLADWIAASCGEPTRAVLNRIGCVLPDPTADVLVEYAILHLHLSDRYADGSMEAASQTRFSAQLADAVFDRVQPAIASWSRVASRDDFMRRIAARRSEYSAHRSDAPPVGRIPAEHLAWRFAEFAVAAAGQPTGSRAQVELAIDAVRIASSMDPIWAEVLGPDLATIAARERERRHEAKLEDLLGRLQRGELVEAEWRTYLGIDRGAVEPDREPN